MAKARRQTNFELAEVPTDELVNEIRRRNEAVICVVWNPKHAADDGALNVLTGFSSAARAADKLDIVELMMKDVVAVLNRSIERGDV